ncbi:hypothetical protein Afil01_23530 [Actinorhabdospora filicis]|uniref:Carrier domain-containing protein n=1 Tax=Actinorhabdospora filicis TaxID=1785913 RepID=A0A9W6SMZ2_9ACTN|nr:non-ribosomal peptide synthetase [Actinorhabdospora filicis]GLZ77546.1 hypothetical protein Afil01_23530 [Actinorhabdospora filicis]
MTAESVPDRFARQARLHPNAPAITGEGRTWTYAEAEAHANRLAHWLLDHGVRPGDRVGLRARRSARTVLAMLGVLRAGAAYVPLEADVPAERLNQIVGECGPSLVLSDGMGLPGRSVWTFPGTAGYPAAIPPVTVDPGDVMYIPYTSGSTGRPKGTVVPHRAVAGFFDGADYAAWGPGSVALHHSALSWDGHVLDIYPALLTGGHVIVHDGPASDPARTVSNAVASGVTVLWLTAQAFNTVVNDDPARLAGLRYLMIGGETVSPPHIAAALDAVPGLRIVNGYGPSECTVFTTAHPIALTDLAGPIPIGRPIGDRRVHVIGASGEADTGELCVGGPAVAHGYLDRPRLTAEKFVPDPFGEPGSRMYRSGDAVVVRPDGVLDFKGRDDGQIKLRGVRIELGEIERALSGHPEIVDAAVAVDRSRPGAERLVGYLVTRGELPTGIAAFLGERLPAAMIPPVYVRLDALPLTRNGKLDRAALVPPSAQDDYEAPVTPAEKELAAIWAELLGVPEVGRRDDFLALGGNSMHATRLVNRLRDRLGVSLPLPEIYRHSVLADLAARIDETRPTNAAPAIRPRARRLITTR